MSCKDIKCGSIPRCIEGVNCVQNFAVAIPLNNTVIECRDALIKAGFTNKDAKTRIKNYLQGLIKELDK